MNFVPAWWCRSGHAQTIWAATLRASPAIAGYQHACWETPDGDALYVDEVAAPEGRPVLLILHGLEGSSRAQQARGFVRVAVDQGWHGVALNFRSCGGRANRLRRSYHAGETDDLRWVVRRLAAEHPGAPIVCVGMSVGGSVLLKYLGEEGDQAPAALVAAAAISAPFDLARSAQAFERDALTRVYMARLLRSLLRKTREKLRRFPDLIDPHRLASVHTIRDFDEVVTAPVHGFASAAEYWARLSCRRFLPSIRRPTLVLNALDDPLTPPETLPYAEISQNPWLTAVFPAHGGHVGFVSGPPARPRVWAESLVAGFFRRHVSAVRDSTDRA
jgi:predicted alpha/beta-fold hydrolase